MKVFQTTQKNFVAAGINSNLVLQSIPLNARIFMGLSMLGLNIICNLLYTFYDAKTFAEYTGSIFMTAAAALILLILLIIVLVMEKLFTLIDNCENIVNTSESNIENCINFTQFCYQ